MPGSGGEEFLWKIRQITDAKICQKINGHSQARPQDATVGEVIEYGEERTGKMSTLSPIVKVAAGAGALVLGYLGYRYDGVPSYFSSHNCRSLILYYAVYWPPILSLFFVFWSRILYIFYTIFKYFWNANSASSLYNGSQNGLCICWHARIDLDLSKSHGRV